MPPSRHESTHTVLRTGSQALADFRSNGQVISRSARSRGFNPRLVYQVLTRNWICLRGESFEIAKALGMKYPDTFMPSGGCTWPTRTEAATTAIARLCLSACIEQVSVSQARCSYLHGRWVKACSVHSCRQLNSVDLPSRADHAMHRGPHVRPGVLLSSW
ncbi:hypothetical protein [Hydrogenophaga sp.]|uniref:hypothetical protein n=1 Tax=Hydrogenophaga sp. TaxID=1904254 RepID=UPI003458D13D